MQAKIKQNKLTMNKYTRQLSRKTKKKKKKNTKRKKKSTSKTDELLPRAFVCRCAAVTVAAAVSTEDNINGLNFST